MTIPNNEEGGNTTKQNGRKDSKFDMMDDPMFPFDTRSGSIRRGSVASMLGERRVLTTLSVVAFCYFNVSGGPIGTEPIISAGGPLVGLIGIIMMPLVWSIPVALITAELSTAIPADGGYTVWVFHAFGPFLAFQEGYWSWISGVIDNALYPGLLVSAITDGYGHFDNYLHEYLAKAAIAIALAIPSLFGIQIIGNGMTLLSVLVLTSFLVLVIWGIPKADFSIISQLRHEDMTNATRYFDGSGPVSINWGTLVNVLFWNFNGFHSMSVFAGEVANPKYTYPISLMICTVLIVCTYVIHLSVVVGVNSPIWSEWHAGSFSSMARVIGGDVLVGWIVAASCCSNIGMYMTELFVDSFQLLGMAKHGLAPAFFNWRHSKYDTPQRTILASVAIIVVLVAFDFESILAITNVLSSVTVLFILFAAIKLRKIKPGLQRPFKGGNGTLIAISFLPILLSLYIIVASFQNWYVTLLISICVVGGLVLYFFQVWTGALSPERFLEIEKEFQDDNLSTIPEKEIEKSVAGL